MRLNGWEWIIILVIVLLLWGGPKLPGLAKSLAQSLRIFKSEIKSDDKNAKDEPKKMQAAQATNCCCHSYIPWLENETPMAR
jgi:sec-independent protein translocase protein TatA